VAGNTLYVWAGRDESSATNMNFVMNEWGVLSTTSATPSGGSWTYNNNVTRPTAAFSWAAQGTAYAAQTIQAANGRYYLYAPVTQASTSASDKFAIGVAVSNSPLGPFTDAKGSPLISQLVPSPGNNIQNIDPAVFVDTDGQVYIYEGAFHILGVNTCLGKDFNHRLLIYIRPFRYIRPTTWLQAQ
jgi:beta-xylosidase